ncbi:MAG: FAD-dependent oxidoreductase [Rhizobiales bacterium]|nr:FAD-dependent oxidoreductase [Hyphomicrobiales bacterium]
MTESFHARGATTRLTRRSLVAGVAAAAVARPASAQSGDVDVVVIGAGAAGYGAVRELKRNGLTVAMIEARDRVGGRVFTDRSLGEPFDAGAQFIHWAERNPWRRIASDLGIETARDVWRGRFLTFRDGHVTTDEDRRRRREAFQSFSALADGFDTKGPDRSFADLAAGDPALRMAAEGASLFSLGDDPQYASAAEYAALWSGDDLVIPAGYGALVAKALADAPVALATPAEAVDWSGGGVRVSTPRGTIRARAAIVTVSVGVLKSSAIRFDPALPGETLAAIEGLRMGAMTKIALLFDGDRFGLPDSTDLFDVGATPGALFSAEAWPFNRNLMLAVVAGSFARALTGAGEAAAVDHALERVVAMAGSDARKHFKAGRLAGWSADPFALGSYSLAKPGHFPDREALARPVGGRIWFAGEATAGGGAMTAGGATLAGERAGREIAGALRKKRV